MAKTSYEYTLQGDTVLVYTDCIQRARLDMALRSEDKLSEVYTCYQNADLHFLMNLVGYNAPHLDGIEVIFPTQPKVDIYIGYGGAWYMELAKRD